MAEVGRGAGLLLGLPTPRWPLGGAATPREPSSGSCSGRWALGAWWFREPDATCPRGHSPGPGTPARLTGACKLSAGPLTSDRSRGSASCQPAALATGHTLAAAEQGGGTQSELCGLLPSGGWRWWRAGVGLQTDSRVNLV